MASSDLTAALLREYFSYDPVTGRFERIKKCYPNSVLGPVGRRVDRRGYAWLNVFNRGYACHRLAWLHVHGSWPEALIDHIDGNKLNNAIANLRLADKSGNAQNQRTANSRSRTGLLGVVAGSQENRFYAEITARGVRKKLGSFPTAEAAHAAYLEAKRTLHPFGTL